MIDLTALEIQRSQMQFAILAEHTQEAYKYGWQSFSAWCKEANVQPLPCTSQNIQLYTVHLVNKGRSLATLGVHFNAISSRHRREGLESPIDYSVRLLVTAIRRLLKQKTRTKSALTVEQLRKLLSFPDSSLQGQRNRAMFIVGFASGLRRSELAGLDVSDVQFVPEGMQITLRKSKTDQEGKGRDIGVFAGASAETCPVRALRAWLHVRGSDHGPLFPRMSGRNLTRKQLGGESVNRVLKQSLARIGEHAAGYGGHSLRAGFVTTAYEAGASEIAIMQVTGHKSVDMVRRYVRPRSVFTVNPLKNAL
jgi:integrase